MILNPSGKEKDYDGILDGVKYEIKFDNAKVGKNIKLGSPDKYAYVLVVFGPDSNIRPEDIEGDFVIYKLISNYVIEHCTNNNYTFGKGFFQKLIPDKIHNYS